MLKDCRNTKGRMKKNLCLLLMFTFLSGCYGSAALLGPASTTTGKLPIEHAVAYAGEKKPEINKEPCLSFVEKTNSKICAIVKRQLNETKSKILKTTKDNPLKDLTSSIQLSINKKSKIIHLD